MKTIAFYLLILVVAGGFFYAFQTGMIGGTQDNGSADAPYLETTEQKADFIMQQGENMAMAASDRVAEMQDQIEPAASDMMDDAEHAMDEAVEAVEGAVENATDALAATYADTVTADGKVAYGNPDAPVRIDEFSSYSCPHCAKFHGATLDELKEKYIETGKVYLVLNDFPLNRPAVEASLTVHCLPADRRAQFSELLYDTQDKWAFEGKHQEYLKKNAALVGLDSEAFEACVNDAAKQSALLEQVKESQNKYNVNSTPTFVFNDGAKTITGAAAFANFDTVITGLLPKDEATKADADAVEPSETPSETEETPAE